MILNDSQIRLALQKHLLNKRPAPFKLINELTVHNGNAIADLVSITSEMHGYEIKGETDNVRRLKQQSGYYDLVFPKSTVVLTKNHLKWAEDNLPTHWGIIQAEPHKQGLKLKHKRKSLNNPYFEKEKSLLILRKQELISAAEKHAHIIAKQKHTREEIAKAISKKLNKKSILFAIKSELLTRASQTSYDV